MFSNFIKSNGYRKYLLMIFLSILFFTGYLEIFNGGFSTKVLELTNQISTIAKSNVPMWNSISMPKRNFSVNIGIIIVVDNVTKLDAYEHAVESMKCYAEMQNYTLEIIVDSLWDRECPQKDFMFKRHCIVSKVLFKYDWVLFIDGDIGVVNPEKVIESFIDPSFDIILLDRYFNWEIMTGSYLVKNTEWARNFLEEFANFESKLPNSFHGTDNGAIHAFIVEKLYPEQQREYDYCHKIWEASTGFGDLFVYEACIRIIFGATYNLGGKNRIKLVPKGKGWNRDGWLTDSQWSKEDDFMLHGWQKSRLIPEPDGKNSLQRENKRKMFASWESPLELPFNHTKCKSGEEKWKWRRSLLSNPYSFLSFLLVLPFTINRFFTYIFLFRFSLMLDYMIQFIRGGLNDHYNEDQRKLLKIHMPHLSEHAGEAKALAKKFVDNLMCSYENVEDPEKLVQHFHLVGNHTIYRATKKYLKKHKIAFTKSEEYHLGSVPVLTLTKTYNMKINEFWLLRIELHRIKSQVSCEFEDDIITSDYNLHFLIVKS